MSVLQAFLLGIVQGATEFLPVSSSGHLVIVPALLGWAIPDDQAFVFDVLVQIGTLLAVFVYFRADLAAIFGALLAGLRDRTHLKDPNARLGWLLLLATIPAGLAGLLLKDQVELAFASPRATAGFLFFTAILLVIAERVSHVSRDPNGLTWRDALWIGLFQALAIFPGVSRSGSTITGGMLRGLDRPASARFAFLMSIPVMLAAGLLSLFDLAEIADPAAFLLPMSVGFMTSAVTGYFAIAWLIGFLQRRSLYGFAAYVAVLAAVVRIVV